MTNFFEKFRLVNANLTIHDQREVLSQFDNISESEIHELTWMIKSEQAGKVIEYLGPHRLRKHLGDFIEILQDRSWPAAKGTAIMLKDAGIILLPSIKRIFGHGIDVEWQQNIIDLILENWKPSEIQELKRELVEMVNKGIPFRSSSALSLLQRKSVLSDNDIKFHMNNLTQLFASNPEALQDLQQKVKDRTPAQPAY